MITFLKAALALMLLAVSTGCAVDSSGGSGGAAGAEWRCENYIKDGLKAPATAKFSDESAVDNGDSTWQVDGAVDSENGFSALIRSTWTCVARDNGGGNWSVDSGNLNDGGDT